MPSKSLSADSEIPRAHVSGHTEKVGEKSDSFSRAERTRPLRPVSRLDFLILKTFRWNVFNGISPDTNWRTRHAVSLQYTQNTSPAVLSWSSLFGTTVLKSFRFCTMLFVFALETVQKPSCFSTKYGFSPQAHAFPQFFSICTDFLEKT